MSFAPTSVVRLLSGVPLDNTYQHTMTFTDATAQETYFTSKLLDQKIDLTYQREERFIDYPNCYDNIIAANYVMFQNPNPQTGARSKWFYAFVTNKEYKSEECTRIFFEIDSWQTYQFDVEIKSCFIEREHVSDDSMGANLIDEGLALGNFVANEVTEHYFNDWWIVVGASVDLKNPPTVVGGRYYGGVFSGVRYYAFNSASSFGAMLDTLETSNINPSDAITIVYMVPKDIVSPNQSDYEELERNPAPSEAWNWPTSTSLNGYTPVNNKLLCYPFRYCNLSNLNGQVATLCYEFESLDAGNFRYQGNVLPDSKIICWPQGYKGVPDNIDEGISMGSYPVCTWVTNSYAAWLSQKQTTNAMALSSAIISGAYSAATGNVAGVANVGSDILGIALNDMKEGVTQSFTPAQARGNASSESTFIARNQFGFRATAMSITADYAKSIDNFFSMFGYKVNKVKRPNITGRPSWNYVKTQNAVVIGRCPSPDVSTIESMLNRGITFWHGDFVGDYSRANK